MSNRVLGAYLTLALTATAVVVGCSSRHRSAAPTTRIAVATSTTHPRRTTTTLSVQEASARYQAAAAALDPQVLSVKARLGADSGDFTKMKGDYQILADAYRAFGQSLFPIAWPQVAAGNGKQVVQAAASLLLWVQAAADASTPASLTADETNVTTAARVLAAYSAALRKDLGLPPAST